jgi:hypothetical protein
MENGRLQTKQTIHLGYLEDCARGRHNWTKFENTEETTEGTEEIKGFMFSVKRDQGELESDMNDDEGRDRTKNEAKL